MNKLTAQLAAFSVVILAGVYLIQNPAQTDALRAVAPSGNVLLYIVAFILAAPYFSDAARWWLAKASLLKRDATNAIGWAKERTPSLGGWKGFLVALVAGIAIGVIAPNVKTIDWRDWFKPSPNPTVPDEPPAPPAPTKPTAVTYVYEKDNGGIPSGVAAGLSKLNAQGIVATAFEEDTPDGSGDTPEQYRVAKAAAQTAGLPALVVQVGDKATKVVKNPSTEQHVLEAAK